MRLVATRARHIRRCKTGAIVTAGLVAIAILPARAEAQDEAGRTEADTSAVADSVYSTSIAGEFRPAKGFDLVRTKRASLNISFYGCSAT